ncbi:ATP-binding protein [Oscillatoria sp. CS-180]|uniref:hybrid sensor histidine kinase/response regulator n=1 Tax=Oscillatoria sp. CS-180 TaxID=3021720 RepID=UPI002330296D|nr:hybrid sensor histidine kinase/response regulator [Oscillatoria sp. CS-180]MDB9525363.1 ATP-binding protein [Oscillatoria sp. CS-180]
MTRQNKSLMGQIVRYFLLLSLVTVGAVSGVAYFQSRNAIKRALFDRLMLTAMLKEDELNRWINDQQEEMLAIANLPEVQSSIEQLTANSDNTLAQAASEDYLRELMGAIVNQHSSLNEILVLSPGGKVLFSTQPETEGNFEAIGQYSYVPMDDEIDFAPNFYPSPNDQTSRMSFAIPFKKADQGIEGLLAMHLNLQRIDEIIRKRTGLGETGKTYLVGNQGSSLASYSFFLSSHDLGEPDADLRSEGIDQAMQGISGAGIYRDYQGEMVVGVYRWLDNSDLALIAEVSGWEAFAPARKLAQTIAISGVSLVGLLTICVYWGARRIARPILAITDAAERLAAGDLRAKAPVLTDNEIGILATVFNQMTEQLRRLYTNLEAEVAERTAELQHTNEDLAQAKEAAEVANHAKSQFLANISHELRTPLNAILGFSQLMIRAPLVQPAQREHLEIINRSGEHLLALINDVLSMSKIEAGLAALNENSFDLFSLLASLENMLHSKASAKGLELRFERSPTVPQHIKADEGKLRQVLINLLGNAIKFTQTGHIVLHVTFDETSQTCSPNTASQGTIKPEQPAARLTARSPNASAPDSPLCLLFKVTDTGPGIAQKDIPNLFKPFVQTTAGHQSHEGTGLGLAISRQFVELMGGHIAVDSSWGQGTTFAFTIQAQPAYANDLSPKTPPRRAVGLLPGQPTYRILVVEDRWENRYLLVNLLQAVGFEVREADDGRAAIALWQSWQPHLIWMDMRMPVMDGYEATRQIRTMEAARVQSAGNRQQATSGEPVELIQSSALKPPHTSTKIIALTASAFEESRSEVLAAGCDDFVRKPFQESAIFDVMAKHLSIEYRYEESQQSDEVGFRTLVGRSQPLNPSETNTSTQLDLASSLQTMPAEWVKAAQKAAIQADGDWLKELITQIPEQERSLKIHLSSLIDQFEFDSILDLTQSISVS